MNLSKNQFVIQIYNSYLNGSLLEDIINLSENTFNDELFLEAIAFYNSFDQFLNESFDSEAINEIQEIQKILDEGFVRKIKDSEFGRDMRTGGRAIMRYGANAGDAIAHAFKSKDTGNSIWTARGRSRFMNRVKSRKTRDDEIKDQLNSIAKDNEEELSREKSAKDIHDYSAENVRKKSSDNQKKLELLQRQKADITAMETQRTLETNELEKAAIDDAKKKYEYKKEIYDSDDDPKTTSVQTANAIVPLKTSVELEASRQTDAATSAAARNSIDSSKEHQKLQTEHEKNKKDRANDIDTKNKTANQMQEAFFLYQLLDNNGYIPNIKNLELLKEGIDDHYFVILKENENISLNESINDSDIINCLKINNYNLNENNKNIFIDLYKQNRILFY